MDASPPRRQPATLAGSIWAPQPQPSEATWPKTLDSFSRAAEQREFDYLDSHGHGHGGQSHGRNPLVRREDVFGPVPPQVTVLPPQKLRSPKDVGAIGDGRRKGSPEFDNTVRHFFFGKYMRFFLSDTPAFSM